MICLTFFKANDIHKHEPAETIVMEQSRDAMDATVFYIHYSKDEWDLTEKFFMDSWNA